MQSDICYPEHASNADEYSVRSETLQAKMQHARRSNGHNFKPVQGIVM